MKQLTAKERRTIGAKQRKDLPRSSHQKWSARSRQHDPLELLKHSMRGRVPSLVAIKYQRMAMSPFGYFRGAVPVMAADLSMQPHTTIYNQICGDAHVRNLGAYSAPDGRMLFDINDFDETIYAPFEWDLKRLAASLVLAGRESGTKESVCEQAVKDCVLAYAALMRSLAELPVLEMARYTVHRMGKTEPISEVLQKAVRSTPMLTLKTLTQPLKERAETETGKEEKTAQGDKPAGEPGTDESPSPALTATRRVFRNNPPLLTQLAPGDAQPVLDSLKEYRATLLPERRHFLDQYRAVDVGFKVVGTGSVGLRDYLVYFEGNGENDPLFLQIKEETQSGYAPYTPQQANATTHQGRRVADGQRAMQFQSDPFLGWTTIEDRQYLVRQLNDHKASIEVGDLGGDALGQYAVICGELLARGHARAGDPWALTGYVGRGRVLSEAMHGFAVNYADQTERDWKALVRSGLGDVPTPPKPEPAKSAKPKAAAAKPGPAGTAKKKAAPKKRPAGKAAVAQPNKKQPAKDKPQDTTEKTGDKNA